MLDDLSDAEGRQMRGYWGLRMKDNQSTEGLAGKSEPPAGSAADRDIGL